MLFRVHVMCIRTNTELKNVHNYNMTLYRWTLITVLGWLSVCLSVVCLPVCRVISMVIPRRPRDL